MSATPQQLEASGQFMQAAQRTHRLPTLYALADEWNQVVGLLEDPDFDPADVEARLREIAGDIKQKAHGAVVTIQALESQAANCKLEELRLATQRKRLEAQAEWLRGYLLENMRAAKLDRIPTGTFIVAIRLNNPSVQVLDEAAIAPEFWRHYEPPPPEVNKLAIMDHWRATGGKSVPDGVTGGVIPAGVQIVRTERLSIS